MKPVDQQQLRIAKAELEKLCDDIKPQAVLVRLAWHDSGTFDVVSDCYIVVHTDTIFKTDLQNILAPSATGLYQCLRITRIFAV